MVWATLAFLGVPLWLCAAGIALLLWNNRKLRKRGGDLFVRVRRPGKKRWTRSHALWVSDVFTWRASPAAWAEGLEQVSAVSLRDPSDDERHKLRHLDDDVTIVTMDTTDGSSLDVAAMAADRVRVVGPFTEASQHS